MRSAAWPALFERVSGPANQSTGAICLSVSRLGSGSGRSEVHAAGTIFIAACRVAIAL
jgi:hypothetical protein